MANNSAPEYELALNSFAATHGKNWPLKLTQAWYNGTDALYRAPDGTLLGHLLRQIRNHPTQAGIL